jgi:hypothetical protein
MGSSLKNMDFNPHSDCLQCTVLYRPQPTPLTLHVIWYNLLQWAQPQEQAHWDLSTYDQLFKAFFRFKLSVISTYLKNRF